MKQKHTKWLVVVFFFTSFWACLHVSSSETYRTVLQHNYQAAELGKAKFLHGDMGGIKPQTLRTNALVYKMAVVALQSIDGNQDLDTKSLFKKYGFAYAERFWNWQNAPKIDPSVPTGLVFNKLSGFHPTKGKYEVEVSDFGCATCHGGSVYRSDGLPTTEFALGLPNTSLNLKGFSQDLFKGYLTIIQWDKRVLLEKVKQNFPDVSKNELTGLEILFQGLRKEVSKIKNTRGVVTNYKVGEVGALNGIGAIKNVLGLLDPSVYHAKEAAVVSIPTLADRNFRSSLLVAGNYAPEGKPFFYEMPKSKLSAAHAQDMAGVAAIFTMGTMGFTPEMAATTVSDMRDVMQFIADCKTPTYPNPINKDLAVKGKLIFADKCAKCHGTYEGSETRNFLTHFPNKLVPLEKIQTDSVRCTAITSENLKVLNKLELNKYVDAQVNRGYVAPILTGVWATAPYLHNGSVPTIWHLMHPALRPAKFQLGGHALDFEKLGIKGADKNGVYTFPDGYRPFSKPDIYDTAQFGLSNSGHEKPFSDLTETEKSAILEFLKTL